MGCNLSLLFVPKIFKHFIYQRNRFLKCLDFDKILGEILHYFLLPNIKKKLNVMLNLLKNTSFPPTTITFTFYLRNNDDNVCDHNYDNNLF